MRSTQSVFFFLLGAAPGAGGGPRPAVPSEGAAYTPRQRQRLLVKRRITCYWQTRRNRDSITFDEWVDLDLLYIKKCGALADLKLIVQTVGCVLTAQGN